MTVVPRRRKRRADGGRRAEVLATLRTLGRPASILEIADRLGVHPNTARFHLRALVETGQVAQVEAERPGTGRPPQLFQVVRRMDPAGPRDYRLLAEVLAEDLAGDPDPAGRAIVTGRSWGRRHEADPTGRSKRKVRAAIDGLIGLLDDLGFAPEREGPRASGRLPKIGLRNCPFLELAADRPQVVCSIHLGLMQGALEGWESDVTVDRLEPFAEPDLCRVHLVERVTRSTV